MMQEVVKFHNFNSIYYIDEYFTSPWPSPHNPLLKLRMLIKEREEAGAQSIPLPLGVPIIIGIR